jgi:cell division septation protein DedD
MATQDFAHIKAPTPEEVRPMGQFKLLLLIMIALGVVAAGFAVGFTVGQQMGMEKASSEDEARLLVQLKAQQEELAKLRAEASKQRQPEVSTTQVGELTFYNELPKQSVDPVPLQKDSVPAVKQEMGSQEMHHGDAVSSEELLKQIIEQELGQTKKVDNHDAATMQPGVYYLQLASFQKQSEAENFFPKLSSSGYAGVIKRVDLAGKGVWYRVYAGPFASKQASEAAKSSVKDKLNITGLIVKGG